MGQQKKDGFTLVELLVVIVIIGILTGMLISTLGSTTDKAEATKILSDMKNIKSAAVLYFMDKGLATDKIVNLSEFLSSQYWSDPENSPYQLVLTSQDTAVDWWYVRYSKDSIPDGVQKKLASMDTDVGLLQSINAMASSGQETTVENQYVSGNSVYMRIR